MNYEDFAFETWRDLNPDEWDRFLGREPEPARPAAEVFREAARG